MLLPLITFLIILTRTYGSLDTIAVNQNISDGKTIISNNAIFELGFFSLGSSKNRYLGIWFAATSPPTIAWVANREHPLNDTSGMVKLDSQGILSIVNGRGTVMWSSNSSASSTNTKPVAQILDTGNLVVRDETNANMENFIWQSFDHPGDTYLQHMKLGKNFITGKETYLTSWRSPDDPSPGDYIFKFLMVKGKYPEVYIMKGSSIETRIGPYNGIAFSGQPNYKPDPAQINDIKMVINQNEMYFAYSPNSTTQFIRMVATPEGKFDIFVLSLPNTEWFQSLTYPIDYCDNFGLCGPYGTCSTATSPNCGCLKGFERSTDNNTSGCRRRSTKLDCGPGEGFLKASSIKLPDTQNAVYNDNMSLQECEVACKDNCSCTAYANSNVTAGGVGCLRWFGDLIDVRVYAQNGQDLYVRLAASELLRLRSSSFNRKKRLAVTITLSISAGLALSLGLIFWGKRKMRSDDADRQGRPIKIIDKNHGGSSETCIEVPLFSLFIVSKATNNFSVDNMLGEGGFGQVYKGVLEGGQEIAVKRLSKFSRQGLNEFENEVICIAKLQHRNLVKLLGYCIQGDETMLIYEYMPNNSLDSFIFDESRKSLLNWPQRFHIIHGIARGLLYLHQDSRLRVVHRDLKAGNILLDHNMTPKISDFGLARMFKEHESEANTKRVVGTLGYISPEYAANGLFSVKSDIFSFGVLVLEIVSGMKNRGFVNEDHHDNLLGHAWRLYKEGKSLDLVDTSFGKSYSVSEVSRSIHIGLLCVQQLAEDRPSAPSVVSMLGGESSLPSPKQPGFFIHRSENVSTIVSSSSILSVNGVTLTQIKGR